MNLENGMYIKAEIRAIKFRDLVNKSTGEVMHFCSLIVEKSAEREKKELQLSKQAVATGLSIELQKLVGETCLIPFYISFKNNYLNMHYSGTQLPKIIREKAQANAG